MTTANPLPHHHRLSEILANAITHGVGAALAIAGAAYLIVASTRGSARLIVSCSIFSASLILVYVCSTLYHSLVRTRARHVFHVLDHAAIYVLIAGTYTPFTLVSLQGSLGWWIFGIEWGLALIGIVFKSFAVGRYELASSAVYLAQGWIAVFAVRPLAHSLGWTGLAWLGAGGAAYSLGVIFFSLDRLRFFHALWHLFVLAGSIAHYFAILFHVVPPRG